MLNFVLRSTEVRNGDIIVAEVRSDGTITEWGDSNPKLGQGWALSGGTTLTNNKTKRRVVFYPDDDRRYRVLRPVSDEPADWGEMAL